MVLRPFHLAFPVRDLASTRRFYGDLLGCQEGRSAERWIDFDFYGHQISAHLVDEANAEYHNPVDGDAVPIPHFGVILRPEAFAELRARLIGGGADWVIPPRTRFAGQAGEQSTMFVRDPSGNVLEFKSFADDAQIYKTN